MCADVQGPPRRSSRRPRKVISRDDSNKPPLTPKSANDNVIPLLFETLDIDVFKVPKRPTTRKRSTDVRYPKINELLPAAELHGSGQPPKELQQAKNPTNSEPLFQNPVRPLLE